MTISGFAPTPDGAVLAYLSSESGRPQPWLRPLDGTGEPRHLPIDGAAVRCAWRPDATRLLVQTDPTGAEDHQLHEIDPASGGVTPIAADPGVRHEIGVPYGSGGDPYSPDGRWLAFASNARDRTVFDILVRDLTDGSVRPLLVAGDQVPPDRYLPMFFSPDSCRLLVLRLFQNTEHDLYVVDVHTGVIERPVATDGPAKYLPAGWTDEGIYTCATLDRDTLGLARLSPGAEPVWLDTPDRDVVAAAIAGRRVFWAVTDDGYSDLYWMDLDGGLPAPVRGLPRGVAAHEHGHGGHSLQPTADGRRLLVRLRTPRAPAAIWVADLDSGSARALVGDELTGTAVAPSVVRYASTDGLSVPGLLYRPPGVDRAGVVVDVHGGPEAASLPGYDQLTQDLVANGIGVFAPNYRGSLGHGMAYQRMIYRDWGGGDLADLAAAVRYLRGLDWVDPDRIAVYGASYGGFATLSCLTRLPELWRTGVSVCGTSDLVADARSVPPTWSRRVPGWIGDPDDPDDAARLVERSPITHIDNLRAPLLLIHGAHDTRVPIEQSERVYQALIERDHPVEFVRFGDEGHETTRAANRATLHQTIVDWMVRYVGATTSPGV